MGDISCREELSLVRMTDGAFDIAIYPVMQEWGFPTKDFKVPDDATLKRAAKSLQTFQQ